MREADDASTTPTRCDLTTSCTCVRSYAHPRGHCSPVSMYDGRARAMSREARDTASDASSRPIHGLGFLEMRRGERDGLLTCRMLCLEWTILSGGSLNLVEAFFFLGYWGKICWCCFDHVSFCSLLRLDEFWMIRKNFRCLEIKISKSKRKFVFSFNNYNNNIVSL